VSGYNNSGLHYFCLDNTTENGTPTIQICQKNDDYERLVNSLKEVDGIAPPPDGDFLLFLIGLT
jgi:hypothetical protein